MFKSSSGESSPGVALAGAQSTHNRFSYTSLSYYIFSFKTMNVGKWKKMEFDTPFTQLFLSKWCPCARVELCHEVKNCRQSRPS